MPTNFIFHRGLSPRVRGNLSQLLFKRPEAWSIPACAGEPRRPKCTHTHRRVYPRVCGGTWLSVRDKAKSAGLSPRVRGNRKSLNLAPTLERSIPACAGEPRPADGRISRCKVYPRVCGGTRCYLQPLRVACGLSPRVRGNPSSSLEIKIE